jgi:hypothetical protein
MPKKKKRIGFIILSVIVMLAAVYISARKVGNGYAGILFAAAVVLFIMGLTNKGKSRQFPNEYREDIRWDETGDSCLNDFIGNGDDDFARHHDSKASDGSGGQGLIQDSSHDVGHGDNHDTGGGDSHGSTHGNGHDTGGGSSHGSAHGT